MRAYLEGDGQGQDGFPSVDERDGLVLRRVTDEAGRVAAQQGADALFGYGDHGGQGMRRQDRW